MSEAEYKELVLADYDRQAYARLLSSELLSPTPANIKAAVVKFCEQNGDLRKEDEKILQSFVGAKENLEAYRNAFRNGKADPFRQVVKLIEKRDINPNIKYVNLLALVIECSKRPYHPGLVSDHTKPPKTSGATQSQRLDKPRPPVDQPDKKTLNKRIWVPAAFVIAAFIGYGVWRSCEVPHGGCMIWNDDRYQQTECKGATSRIPIYRLNKEVVAQMRRIEYKDTLTQYAVGKYFWAKDHGEIQFYTDSGPCPFDTAKRLLRVSAYILQQHVPRH